MAFAPAFAQNFNDKADNIVGEYLTDRGGSKSKVRVTKNAQGTYDAQVFWVEKPLDDKAPMGKLYISFLLYLSRNFLIAEISRFPFSFIKS